MNPKSHCVLSQPEVNHYKTSRKHNNVKNFGYSGEIKGEGISFFHLFIFKYFSGSQLVEPSSYQPKAGQTTIHTNIHTQIHTYFQFSLNYEPNLSVWGLWEKTRKLSIQKEQQWELGIELITFFL